jgi:acid stress-induced BolA-like protein IbaG/YrbA
MDRQTVEDLIRNGLEGADVQVQGDDGVHFEATIVYAGFEGKSLVQRHRMVYGTLGDRMHAEIHALSMKTLTPAEAGGA